VKTLRKGQGNGRKGGYGQLHHEKFLPLFKKALHYVMQRHDLPPDGNIDAAPTSRIVEDLRERVDMYFKTVYDEKDSWPTEYGDKMQWSSVSDSLCRYCSGTYPRHVLYCRLSL